MAREYGLKSALKISACLPPKLFYPPDTVQFFLSANLAQQTWVANFL